MSGRQKKSLRSISLLFSTLVLGTMLIMALAAIRQLYLTPERVSILPENSPPPSPQSNLSVPEIPDTEQSLSLSTQPLSNHDRRVNLLLIGQDSREADSQARSDAMILCSFCPNSQTITLISFLRDLYVQIPGHDCNRLNAAYAFGGMSLLKNTITQNFDIRLDGCMEVDFQQFVQLVDLMGGVSLDLRQDEAQLLNRLYGSDVLTEGLQQLNGTQALAYARIRNLDPDSDFSRTLRQRKLLTAMLSQLRHCSLREILALLASARDLVSTDLSKTQVVSCVTGLLPFLSGSEINHLKIPADGTYDAETIDGMAVLVADFPQNKAILRAALAENE